MAQIKISAAFSTALLFLLSSTSVSQELKVSIGSAPPGYGALMQANKEIRGNTILNEELVDLVEVYLTDSILPRKVERHRLAVVGGFTRMVGKRWVTINWRKEKFVGTAKNGFRIPGEKEHFTEYDVNVNLIPHLKKHIDLSYAGHLRQKEIGRKKQKHDNYTRAPFIYPDEHTDLSKYDLHCELSPLRAYRSMINELVYPVMPGNSASAHPHFGNEQFTAGVYGPFISDCNHSCHPEIHPYEWLWWLDVHPNTDKEPMAKTWVFGLFREGSNRFPKWSPKPRSGEIVLPFAIPAEIETLKIEHHHLVFSRFNDVGFAGLNLPEEALKFDKTNWNFAAKAGGFKDVVLSLSTNAALQQQELQFWFSDLTYDPALKMITGKYHIAGSVDDIYCAKVKFSY